MCEGIDLSNDQPKNRMSPLEAPRLTFKVANVEGQLED